jgi:hypothetical protein
MNNEVKSPKEARKAKRKEDRNRKEKGRNAADRLRVFYMGILSAHFVVASWVKIASRNRPAEMAEASKGQLARRYTKSIEFVSLRAKKKKGQPTTELWRVGRP